MSKFTDIIDQFSDPTTDHDEPDPDPEPEPEPDPAPAFVPTDGYPTDANHLPGDYPHHAGSPGIVVTTRPEVAFHLEFTGSVDGPAHDAISDAFMADQMGTITTDRGVTFDTVMMTDFGIERGDTLAIDAIALAQDIEQIQFAHDVRTHGRDAGRVMGFTPANSRAVGGGT